MKIRIVKGTFGHVGVYLNDYRIAGSKPWGGGKTIHEWTIKASDLKRAMKRKP